MEKKTIVVMVGAGPARLATSACLNLRNVPNIVFEKEDCYASPWRKRAYDRLKLHLAKQFCELPYLPFPPTAPTYVPKHSFILYMDVYVCYFNVTPTYSRNVVSASFDQSEGSWVIIAEHSRFGTTENWVAKFLVVATGENSEGYIPPIPVLDSFDGEVMHSRSYDNGERFQEREVLVVGSGNSGMEIALDLCNWGAHTSLVVRSPVFPSIRTVAGDHVYFMNGQMKSFNAIVFATGYRSTVRKWLKDDGGLFADDGMPKKNAQDHWKGENGLYCAGFSMAGLFGISNDAKAIANDIYANLNHHN